MSHDATLAVPLAVVTLASQRRRHASRCAKRRLRKFIRAVGESDEREEQNPLQWALSVVSGLLGSFMASSRESDPETSGEEAANALVQQLGSSPIDAQQGVPIYALGTYPACTEASNLRRLDRHFTVVTTAALPWSTGPSINPLLRALYLAKRGHPVVLLMPWIERDDQDRLFTGKERFDTCGEQGQWILKWCKERASLDVKKLPLELRWYPASYVEAVRSIFPKGDCSQELADSPKDVLILEEPEHLCWYHNGQRWSELFRHVVGVVHTNYQVYLENMNYEGLLDFDSIRDSLFSTFTSMVCSAYCDVTIKLSSAGIALPNEVKCNVHGVRQEFMDIGRRSSQRRRKAAEDHSSVYFIGKAVMPKGWAELIELVQTVPKSDELGKLHIEAYGSGPDADEIEQRIAELKQKQDAMQPSLIFFPGIDHADKRFENYKVLINPSTTEMLCTVTAEALAMGKRVVIPDHPSNLFFKKNFEDRCSFFASGDPVSFAKALQHALAQEGPKPVSAKAEAVLSWDSAIDRLIDFAEVRVLSGNLSRPSEARSSRLAYELHKGIQTDTPGLSELLKDATLKNRPSWQKWFETWTNSGSSAQVLKQIRKFMRLQGRDVV